MPLGWTVLLRSATRADQIPRDDPSSLWAGVKDRPVSQSTCRLVVHSPAAAAGEAQEIGLNCHGSEGAAARRRVATERKTRYSRMRRDDVDPRRDAGYRDRLRPLWDGP